MRLSFAAGVATLALLLPRSARADDTLLLFNKGRGLVEQGKWSEACPLFAEAHRLQPTAIGITLNLAECYEHIGKTAAAWQGYREAEFLSKVASDTGRAHYAAEHAAALEPKLSHLQIDAEATPGLVVRRDQQEVSAGLLATLVPVDPGPHKVEATAPGYLVWSTTVVVGPGGDTKKVIIPSLGKIHASNAQRSAGIAVVAVGLASLAVGGALGGLAITKNNASKADCSSTQPNLCHPDGISLRQAAMTLADASTGTFIAGGVLVAAGIAVFATASTDRPRVGALQRLELAPMVGFQANGLRIGGAW